MNNENFHPKLKEPPIAHALHKWDDSTRTLTYEYNGVNLITIQIPGTDDVGFRHGSDGSMLNIPYFQNIYLMLDNPVKAKVIFSLSKEAINMRPNRATHEQAILGQVGRPLIYGVSGLYDITQDLLIDWYGCDWEWSNTKLKETESGELTAELDVELGPKPWNIILRMHYYRTHLGYTYHKPWEFRPNTEPVSGWCSWEACRRNVAYEDIANFSKFFAGNLKDYGLKYIQLDDGFENLPLPLDPDKTLVEGWLETNERFPTGHSGVVEVIKENGFEPAIWTNANVTNKEFAYKNRECFIEGNDGNLMLGEWIDFLLNCSDETLEKHVMPYYKGLKELGYTYFKTDAIRHLILDGLHEAVRQGLMTNADAEARFRRFMEYARKGIGDDRYFLASWGVLAEVIGLVDACRIAMDANPTWAGIRMQIVESARWFHSQRILFVNDPDHICARTDKEWLKSVISLVSLTGSLCMLSDPLNDYDDDRIEIIKKNLPTLETFTAETGPLDMNYPAFTWTKLHGFAVNSKEKPVEAEGVSAEDALNMAGIYPTMNDAHPHSSLWSFHIDKNDRMWCVVGRFATVPLKATTIKLEDIGLNPSDEYLVFDFWEQRFLCRITGTFEVSDLKLGSCQVLSICKAMSRPQLIASSRHVSMDAVSVKSERFIENELIVNITGVLNTKETYWFHVNNELDIKSVTMNDKKVKYEKQEGILKVEVEFTSKENTIKIKV